MDWSTSENQLPLHEIFRVEEMVAEIELNECWRKCEPHILVIPRSKNVSGGEIKETQIFIKDLKATPFGSNIVV